MAYLTHLEKPVYQKIRSCFYYDNFSKNTHNTEKRAQSFPIFYFIRQAQQIDICKREVLEQCPQLYRYWLYERRKLKKAGFWRGYCLSEFPESNVPVTKVLFPYHLLGRAQNTSNAIQSQLFVLIHLGLVRRGFFYLPAQARLSSKPDRLVKSCTNLFFEWALKNRRTQNIWTDSPHLDIGRGKFSTKDNEKTVRPRITVHVLSH